MAATDAAFTSINSGSFETRSAHRGRACVARPDKWKPALADDWFSVAMARDMLRLKAGR